MYERCTEGLPGYCTSRSNLADRSSRYLSDAEKNHLRTVPTCCTDAPPPVRHWPEAETTGAPGTCTERLENFEMEHQRIEGLTQGESFRTGASPNELATQLECEGEFLDAQCTDTDEAGILQYCLPECTHILDDSQTCNSIPLGAGDKCSDFAEQFSPFVRFQTARNSFLRIMQVLRGFRRGTGSASPTLIQVAVPRRACRPNTNGRRLK